MIPLDCPKCKADLAYIAPEESIPDPLGFTPEPETFSRVIGVYSRELDRTTHWRCPDCGAEWERK